MSSESKESIWRGKDVNTLPLRKAGKQLEVWHQWLSPSQAKSDNCSLHSLDALFGSWINGSPCIISVFANPSFYCQPSAWTEAPILPQGWRGWAQAALLERKSWIWCQKVSSACGNGTWRIQQRGSGECLSHPDLHWKTNALTSCELLFFMAGLAGEVLMSWEKGHPKPNSCQKFLWIVVFLVWEGWFTKRGCRRGVLGDNIDGSLLSLCFSPKMCGIPEFTLSWQEHIWNQKINFLLYPSVVPHFWLATVPLNAVVDLGHVLVGRFMDG